MPELPDAAAASLPPRPLPATYWVVPGRLLVGEHPGSQSRAEAMDRLRRFLLAGITCFVDLTEAQELPSYESLLPFATPEGRRVEYLREPIRDHGVPAGPETMARAIAMIDDALAAGHVVYLHCRAGIGRSATVAGCWLASRGTVHDPLRQLQEFWQQSERSRHWPTVPETEEQAEFVRAWTGNAPAGAARIVPPAPAPATRFDDRVRGALLGLALGDAAGAAAQGGRGAGLWTQHTALALCLAESLLEKGVCDARDQIERYLAWQRSGHLSADGRPGQASADVARVLAAYQWRRLPMAGPHDPRDRSTASLPRVVSAAAFCAADPAAAVTLAVECARTTHQSPVVLDACRFFAALMSGALRGESPAALFAGVFEPVVGLWQKKPLKEELLAALTSAPRQPDAGTHDATPDVTAALARVRAAVAASGSAAEAIARTIRAAAEPAVEGALAGALAGALWGADALPAESMAALARRDLLEGFAERFVERQRRPPPAAELRP